MVPRHRGGALQPRRPCRTRQPRPARRRLRQRSSAKVGSPWRWSNAGRNFANQIYPFWAESIQQKALSGGDTRRRLSGRIILIKEHPRAAGCQYMRRSLPAGMPGPPPRHHAFCSGNCRFARLSPMTRWSTISSLVFIRREDEPPSASDCREGKFVLLLVMARSPPADERRHFCPGPLTWSKVQKATARDAGQNEWVSARVRPPAAAGSEGQSDLSQSYPDQCQTGTVQFWITPVPVKRVGAVLLTGQVRRMDLRRFRGGLLFDEAGSKSGVVEPCGEGECGPKLSFCCACFCQP
jgi:hypothetical protein